VTRGYWFHPEYCGRQGCYIDGPHKHGESGEVILPDPNGETIFEDIA